MNPSETRHTGERRTTHTPSDPAALLDERARTRQCGRVLDDEERKRGMLHVAATIVDEPGDPHADLRSPPRDADR